jgi:prepilin-type N-terminal cleavage/methylation domain-containing protein
MVGMTRLSCRGYTLIEVLMAMALSALIVGGMALVLQTQERAYRAQAAAREELQQLEGAVQQFQKDLQLAGANIPSGTLPVLDPGPGRDGLLVTIRYLTDAPFVTKLTAATPDESKLFSIPKDAISHFRRGDQVLIHHDGAWLAFRVGEMGSRIRPGLSPEGAIRRSVADESLRLVFPQGSAVIRLRDAEVQYLLEEGDDGDQILLRWQAGRWKVIVEGLQGVSVEYLLAPSGNGKGVGPQWNGHAPAGTWVLGARVRLAAGRSSLGFTVTPRNLSAPFPAGVGNAQIS